MYCVLDACALIALLNGDEGADIVAELLMLADNGVEPSVRGHLFMSGIQVMEVYYDRIYVKSVEYADTVLESIYAAPITVLDNVSCDIIKDAGRFKTLYSMSLADAFAAATAKSLGIALVTKDSEMKEARELSILWLK